MIIDGRAIAEKIKSSLKEEILKSKKSASWRMRLAVIKVGGDAVMDKFLEQKKKFGEAIGVDVRIYEIPTDISTNKLREKISEIVHIKKNDGVIIQLPLPSQINAQYILDAITPEKDPDMLSSRSWGVFITGKSRIISPVVGAIKTIFDENKIELKGKNAVVVGAGRLVGKPIATWLINQGVTVSVIDENTLNPKSYTLNADIIISGAGRAGIIKSDMVKDGVIIIDAGASVEGSPSTGSGRALLGDVDPKVVEKSSVFSPVPGGIGPITVAMLFKNLIELAK